MIKKIVALLMGLILAISISIEIPVQAESDSSEVYSQDFYDGYELEWMNNGNRDILLSVSNESEWITFEYDENYNRKSKRDSDGNLTLYTYDDEGKLLCEQRDGHTLFYQYTYDDTLESITIDGNVYYCELDDNSVSKLYDQNGDCVVVYEYSDGKVSSVLGINEEGALVNKNSVEDFIGNINRVTYNSHYYDIETGWYYCGRYLDVTGGRYIDGRMDTEREIERLLQESAISPCTSPNIPISVTIASRAATLCDALMQSAEYGVDIEYSPNWYAGLSDIEMLARTITGECPYMEIGQNGAALAIYSRYLYDKNQQNNGLYLRYSNDASLIGVITKSSQFMALTGANSGGTVNARKVRVLSERWENATLLACRLFICVQYDDYPANEVVIVPSGYTDQKEFRSWISFRDNASDVGGVAKYSGANIYKICIPGCGLFSSVSDAKAAYLNTYGDIRQVNIYFSWEP